MPVFSQLMMKKKEANVNYINLITEGTPTINNGVVSNFSGANRLKIPMTYDVFGDDFEVQFKFTTGELTSQINTVFNFSTNVGSGDTERICLNLTNQTTCNTVFRTSLSDYYATDTQNVFSANTTYYIKFVYKNSFVTISISTNGSTWTTLQSGAISGAPTFLTGRFIGYSNYEQAGRYFRGSIDLKESYIKHNGAMYKFVV